MADSITNMSAQQQILVPTELPVPIGVSSRPVAIHGDTAVVGDPSRNTLFGRGAGAVYVYRHRENGWVQEAELIGSDSLKPFSLFGSSVALFRDRLIVGAAGNGADARLTGAVYCYSKVGTAWGLDKILFPPRPVESGRFGSSLAMDGDVLLVTQPTVQPAVFAFRHDQVNWVPAGTLVGDAISQDFGSAVAFSADTGLAIVGASSFRSHNIFHGAAYIYVWDGAERWSRSAQLLPENPVNAMRFGSSVAISGLRALVGAPFARVADVEVGTAELFEAQGDDWSSVQTLRASDPASGDGFGDSVALTATTALVGSPGDDSATGPVRSAYVFERSGSAWVETAKLSKADRPADFATVSTSLSGDTLMMSISRPQTGGSASVFRRSGSSWQEEVVPSPREGSQQDKFGSSVSISGDTVAVGAPGDDDPARAVDSGAVYLFARTSSKWEQRQRLAPATPTHLTQMGFSVALSDNLLLVGSPNTPQGGPTEPGQVHVFSRVEDRWVSDGILNPSDAAQQKIGFGWAVAISGDTAIVGARSANTSLGGKTGAAYVFVRRDGRWNEQAKLVGSAVAPGHFSGTAVAIDGNTAVVGSPAGFGPGPSTGSAYVFVRSGSTWNQQAVLAATNAAPRDNLGSSVAISGNRIVAGAPGRPNTSSAAGYACVFTRSGTSWSQEARLVPPAGPTRFGTSVAIASGERIVVGDPINRKAYIFVQVGGLWQQTGIVDGTLADTFGSSVATSDGTVIVGAPFAGTTSGPSGAAVVTALA